ncbi:MAG: hypothetical protein R2873_04680 [Caldilineaceae bacterium]
MWSTERRTAIFLTVTLWVIYLITYSGLLHSVDEQSLLAMGETLLTGEGWHVNQMAWEQAWSPPQSAPGVDGNLYVYKRGFLLALLALPLFALGKLSGALGAVQSAMLLGPLISALTGYFLYRALRRVDTPPQVAVIAVLAWGTTTLAFPYARMLFTEPMAALCMIIAFDALLAWRQARDDQRSGRFRLALAGGALGLLFVNKLANAVVIPVFGIYVLYHLLSDLGKGRSWGALIGDGLAFGLPVLAGLAPALGYNLASFGVLLPTPFSGDEGFTTPLWIGLSGLLFSPGKGLLWYSPTVWLLFPGLWIGLRRPDHRAERLLALGVFVILLGIYASWFDWAGGRSWGPRFLTPTLPLLVLLAAPALTWLIEGSRTRRLLVAAVLVLSVAAQLPGVLTNPSMEEARLLSSASTEADVLALARFAPALRLARHLGRTLGTADDTATLLATALGMADDSGDDDRVGRRLRWMAQRSTTAICARRGGVGRAGDGRHPAVGSQWRSTLAGNQQRSGRKHGAVVISTRSKRARRRGIARSHSLFRHHRAHVDLDEQRAHTARLHRSAAPAALTDADQAQLTRWLQPHAASGSRCKVRRPARPNLSPSTGWTAGPIAARNVGSATSAWCSTRCRRTAQRHGNLGQ